MLIIVPTDKRRKLTSLFCAFPSVWTWIWVPNGCLTCTFFKVSLHCLEPWSFVLQVSLLSLKMFSFFSKLSYLVFIILNNLLNIPSSDLSNPNPCLSLLFSFFTCWNSSFCFVPAYSIHWPVFIALQYFLVHLCPSAQTSREIFFQSFPGHVWQIHQQTLGNGYSHTMWCYRSYSTMCKRTFATGHYGQI